MGAGVVEWTSKITIYITEDMGLIPVKDNSFLWGTTLSRPGLGPNLPPIQKVQGVKSAAA
jgi:hypothetical protein